VFVREPHKCFITLDLIASVFTGRAEHFGSKPAFSYGMTMKEADRDRIRELCSLIAVEQNQHKLLQLIEELSRLLGAKDKDEDRLKDKQIGI
jgi:hypothetical protein